MRARNIKPGYYKNEDIVECSFPARLLFPGLWMMADREGRLEYRPKKIKMEIFPADNLDVEDLMAELEKHRLILRYQVNGQDLIWIPGFKKHQTPHHREKASELPPHPEDQGEPCLGCDASPEDEDIDAPRPGGSPGQAQGKPKADPRQAQERHGSAHLIPDSGFLNPERKAEEEDSLRSSSCAEVLADSAPTSTPPAEMSPIVCTLPLNDGSEHEIRRAFVDQMERLYPAVDVIQELKRMKGWLIGNPKNRKTKRGITKFITSWLDREQNKARASPARDSPSGQMQPRTYSQAQDLERRQRALRLLQGGEHGNSEDDRRNRGQALDIAAQLPERT